MRWISKNNYHKKKPIFFLHGFGDHACSFFDFQSQLQEYDYYAPIFFENLQISNYVFPKLEWYAEQVANYAINHNLTNIVLVGHSMGGTISLLLARLIPERISKIILISPYIPRIDWLMISPMIKRFKFIKNFYLKNWRKFGKKIVYEMFIKGVFYDHQAIEKVISLYFNYYSPAEIIERKKRIIAEMIWFSQLLFPFKLGVLKKIHTLRKNYLIKHIKMCYIAGKNFDILTPNVKRIPYLCQRFPLFEAHLIPNSAHMCFLSNYADTKKVIDAFLAK